MIRNKKRVVCFIACFAVAVSSFTFLNILNTQIVHAATNITSKRISGIDRYETAAKITQSGWADTCDYAIITTGDNFPDALCAAPLAKKFKAPIILTNTSSLNANANSELIRLKVKNVIIVGGTGVVSENVEKQIQDLGIKTERIAGNNRFETSEKVAEKIGTSDEAVIATGDNFPDALSIAPIAAIKGIPILLTTSNNLSNEIKPYLSSNNITNTYVIGGTGVISDTVLSELKNPKRLAGNNRYDTNIAILNEFSNDLNLENIYTATGVNFPDALACSALASSTESPLLLIDGVPAESTKTYIDNHLDSIKNCTAIGGSGVISDILLQRISNDFGQREIATFKDPNLELAIRTAINKPTGELKKSDVEDITELTGKNVTDISGIENLVSLKKLDLDSHALAGDPGERYSNDVSDLTPLATLTDLEYLDLFRNQVSDISPLKGLTKLTYLDLSVNTISDCSTLTNLVNLKTLYLGRNQINDFSALKGLTNLQNLSLGISEFNDLSQLSYLTNLQTLDLDDNHITDISPLKALTNLKTLYLDENEISDISAVKELTNLYTLELDNNKVSDISAVKGLTNLNTLGLSDNQISNIDPLRGLNNMIWLNIARNQISADDIKSLQNDIARCNITH